MKRFYPTGLVTVWTYNGYAWTFERRYSRG